MQVLKMPTLTSPNAPCPGSHLAFTAVLQTQWAWKVGTADFLRICLQI